MITIEPVYIKFIIKNVPIPNRNLLKVFFFFIIDLRSSLTMAISYNLNFFLSLVGNLN